jgi:transposase-like protein
MFHQNGKRPDPEVQPRATRRTFTAEYKRRILAEADACRRGEVGALLRREGLYYSHLAKWRGEREAGTLRDKRREQEANPDRAEVKRLARENAALKRKLEQAEAIIEAQKKLARLLDSREDEQP